jgi:hypothetical protein
MSLFSSKRKIIVRSVKRIRFSNGLNRVGTHVMLQVSSTGHHLCYLLMSN